MQKALSRSTADPPSPSGTSRDHLSRRYRALQSELKAIVNQVPSPHPREDLVRHAVEGSIKLFDAVILAELIESQRPARILEVGSFIGFSTRWLLEASKAVGSVVVSVDPGIRHRVFDRPTEILQRFNERFLNSRLILKQGFFSQALTGDFCYDYEHYSPSLPRAEVESLFRACPVLTSQNLGEESFDFIFIDGDHSESAVAANFADALALLKPGGQIAFHDALTWPDVRRALDRIGKEYPGRGEVEILGRDSSQPGQALVCDGIGVFRSR